MFKIIVLVLAAMPVIASANGAKVYYTDSSGKTLDVVTAITQSMDGKPIMRCQAVVAAPNKTGTNVTFKVVKKSAE